MGIFSDSFPDTPFQSAFFGRENDYSRIKQILDSYSNGLVLSLNAPWGSGKTWFLDSFSRNLILENYTVLNYNAWNNEIADNPFASFIASIYSDLEKIIPDIQNAKVKDQFFSIVRKILKYSIPVLVKLLLGTKIDIDSLSTTGTEAITASSDFIKDFFEESNEKKETFASFKTELSSLAVKATRDGHPLIILIDELDRCCPLYMIRFLEVLKHFFEINNIVFILAIDKEKICESIKHVYGNGIDPEGYLRKIVNVQYRLSLRNDQYSNDYILIINHFSNGDKELQDLIYFSDMKTISLLCSKYQLPIRTIILLLHALKNAFIINSKLKSEYRDIISVFFIYYILLAADKSFCNSIFINIEMASIDELIKIINSSSQITPREKVLKYIIPLTALLLNHEKALAVKEKYISEEEFSKIEFLDDYKRYGSVIATSIINLKYLEIDI